MFKTNENLHFYLQHLCRHVLENQHKLMRLIQQQIRLCSTGPARTLHKQLDEDDVPKRIIIPPAAYDTKSMNIEHDPENGTLFKVRGHSNLFKILFCFQSNVIIRFRFVSFDTGRVRIYY